MNYKNTTYFLSIYNLLLLAGAVLTAGCHREGDEPTQHVPTLKQPIEVIDENTEQVVAAKANRKKRPRNVSPRKYLRSRPRKQKPFIERVIIEETSDEYTPYLPLRVFEQVYNALREVPNQFLITEWPTVSQPSKSNINDEIWLNETWDAMRKSVIDCLSDKLVSNNVKKKDKQIDQETLLKVFGDTLPDAYETDQKPGEGITRCFGSLKKAIKPLLEAAAPRKNNKQYKRDGKVSSSQNNGAITVAIIEAFTIWNYLEAFFGTALHDEQQPIEEQDLERLHTFIKNKLLLDKKQYYYIIQKEGLQQKETTEPKTILHLEAVEKSMAGIIEDLDLFFGKHMEDCKDEARFIAEMENMAQFLMSQQGFR